MTMRDLASASAPASSGNLGPGFDVLGLALDLRCVVGAQRAERMTRDAFEAELARLVDVPADFAPWRASRLELERW